MNIARYLLKISDKIKRCLCQDQSAIQCQDNLSVRVNTLSSFTIQIAGCVKQMIAYASSFKR